MKPIADRLEASLRFDAINGDAHERSVVASQIKEAIAALRAQVQEAEAKDAILTEAANRVLEIRDATVMSKYASQAECKAARDALWRAALAVREMDVYVPPPQPN